MTLLVPDRDVAVPPAGAVPVSVSTPRPEPAADAGARRHRFTLAEYLRLSELGLFAERRVEFIDGDILDMASQKNRHAYGVTLTSRWCGRVFPEDRNWVRGQTTLLAAGSAPEPDVSVLDFPATADDSYTSADHALLVVEVADSTLLADTTTKMSLYAAAGIQDYWVLSLPDDLLIVHRRPIPSAGARHGFAYAEVRRVARGETVAPLAAPTAAIDPAQLLP